MSGKTRVERTTIADLRAARRTGRAMAMLTCYDYTTAGLLYAAGVRALLVGDSAASVILGHPNTLPAPLPFMIEITAAVRRGAPQALVMADMPFGYSGPQRRRAFDAACRMVKLSGCDCVKLEADTRHAALFEDLAAAGVATVAHLGLRPQSLQQTGAYKAAARSPADAARLVATAALLEKAGAAALLLEAVPAAVAERVVDAVSIPVIGCGAGRHCHAHVVVLHDLLGWSDLRPRFVPEAPEARSALLAGVARYVAMIESGEYPGDAHEYTMESAAAPREAARLKE